MKYRPEIDGLRAIAVIPVILFHGGLPGFRGGYLGVDIFFVLSGYLITSLITKDLTENRFSILDFYERRARRILPALFVVIMSVSVIAWKVLVPAAMLDFSKSVVSVICFISNVFFWRQSNYFSPASEMRPLLHTWSLGIEEQFYLAYPLLVAVVWKYNRKMLGPILTSIAAASLALAQILVLQHPSAAFFLMPSRAWELMVGGLAALHLRSEGARAHFRKRQFTSIAAAAILSGCLVCFDKSMPLPGLLSIVPTAATALLIIHAWPDTLVGRALAWKPLVFIGLLSYSAYLWHQPLFAMTRHALPGAPSRTVMFSVAISSLILAFITWKFIERPYRNRQSVSRRMLITSTCAVALLTTTFAIAGTWTDGFRKARLNEAQENALATALPSPLRDECHYRDENRHPKVTCEYFHKPPRWAVLGDSHAVELAYALATELGRTNIGVRHYSRSACGPEYGNEGSGDPCQQWTREAITQIVGSRSITNVVLSYRINLYLHGDHALTYPELPEKFTTQKQNERWRALLAIIGELESAGKSVTLVLQAPELPDPVEKLVLFHDFSSGGNLHGVPLRWWLRRNAFVRAHLSAVPRSVQIVDPTNLFCDRDFCYAIINGNSLYFDDNHMSVAGATLVAATILHPRAGTKKPEL